MSTGDPTDDRIAGLYATFRPRFARAVTLGLMVLVLGFTAALVIALPSIGPEGRALGDRVAMGLFGLGIAWFCWRQASVQARVDPDGVTVRNLLLTRRLTWAEIVSVRFGQGRPWVQLDLSDGDTLAVMGVQRSDGAYADAQARRFATLVALHSRTARDD